LAAENGDAMQKSPLAGNTPRVIYSIFKEIPDLEKQYNEI
jgi:hypothetical protein